MVTKCLSFLVNIAVGSITLSIFVACFFTVMVGNNDMPSVLGKLLDNKNSA